MKDKVQAIAEKYAPEKIILFGSLLHGKFHARKRRRFAGNYRYETVDIGCCCGDIAYVEALFPHGYYLSSEPLKKSPEGLSTGISLLQMHGVPFKKIHHLLAFMELCLSWVADLEMRDYKLLP
ncbi:MAG: hypothetical protein ACE5NG_11425 [bacterium]